MLTQRTIDNIRDISIVEVVEKYYSELKANGKNFTTCCPFHDEKTPSFIVNPERNVYKCFGCGVSGDAIEFVKEHKNLTFHEAVKTLSQDFNINLEYDYNPLDKDSKAKAERKMKAIEMVEWAAKKYHETLKKAVTLPAYIKADIEKRQLDEPTINYFNIGYAPADFQFLSNDILEKGLTEQAKDAGIINVKNNRTYDFYMDRIILPIRNEQGLFVSMGGRGFDDKFAKYLNGPDSDFYHKEQVLYGLYESRDGIKSHGFAFLVEGYFDVISLHRKGFNNAIAASGTAFSIYHAKLLKRYTDKVVLFMDNDVAGRKASLASLKILLHLDFKVDIITDVPEGKDPDDFCREYTADLEIFFEENRKDALIKFGIDILEEADTINEKDKAIEEVAELLSYINRDFKVDEYIKIFINNFKKKYEINKSGYKELVLKQRNLRIKKNEKHIGREKVSEDYLNRMDMLRTYGFYEVKDVGDHLGYYVATGNDDDNKPKTKKISNFILQSLFLIEEKKRIVQITNDAGFSRLVELNGDEITSLKAFDKKLELIGDFIFLGSMHHLKMIKKKLYKEDRVCKEIETVGWQEEKFWAMGNGVYDCKEFHEVDEYGIAVLNDKYYFIPAFSLIYKNSNSVDYQRKFIHKMTKITFKDWSNQFMQVYGKTNGSLGIIFYIASLFRDIVYDRFNFFPHLFLFGPPRTGKSALALSLVSMFGEKPDIINLNATTRAAFKRLLMQKSNAMVWMDEYNNHLMPEIYDSLKGSYDGATLTRGEMSMDIKTNSVKVKSSLIISGQELPTIDNNALFTRCILLTFKNEYKAAELLDKLRIMERDGLTVILFFILTFREFIEDNFNERFDFLLKAINEGLKIKYPSYTFDDRIKKNYLCLYTFYSLLKDDLQFPFSGEDLTDTILSAIYHQNKQIESSNDMAIFWDMVESLNNKGVLRHGTHYKIEKEVNDTEFIYIRFGIFHGEYMKELRMRGSSGMNKNSLQSYMKQSPEFADTVSNYWFNREVQSSAYKINYTMVKQLYGISLKDKNKDESELDI